MTTPKEAPLWRCEIKYGPEGEANYAWVYDADGEMVCTARTHHAEAIVTRMNALASLQGEDAVERVARGISRAMLDNPTGGTSEERTAKRKAIAAEYAAAYVADLATGLVPDEAAVRADERETGWLVEWPAEEGNPTRWWSPRDGWITDAGNALRFARKQDAESYIRSDGKWFVAGVVATEHVWVPAIRSNGRGA